MSYQLVGGGTEGYGKGYTFVTGVADIPKDRCETQFREGHTCWCNRFPSIYNNRLLSEPIGYQMEASSANAPIFGGVQPVPPRRTRVAASELSTVSNRFHAF